MTDGLRKSHLRKAPQVGLSEVGLPDIYHEVSIFTSIEILVQSQLVLFEGTVGRQYIGAGVLILVISLLSRLWKHAITTIKRRHQKLSRAAISLSAQYTKSSYHWDENTPKYAQDASKIWLKIILFRMKFCKFCPKT